MTTTMWNIIQIQHGSEEFWARHGFIYVCTVTLTLVIWPLVKAMTPLEWQQIVWIFSKFLMAVKSLRPDTDFSLTLGLWPWVKTMTHPLVFGDNCVKYYLDPTWKLGVMARTTNLGMVPQWPSPYGFDLGWTSWHTTGSWITDLSNEIQIRQGRKKKLPWRYLNRRRDIHSDGQPDWRTGWFLYIQTLVKQHHNFSGTLFRKLQNGIGGLWKS